jgi:hypothetical protein
VTVTPRLARSLATLRDQVDAAFPTRSKASDGWIGNAAHQAEGDYTASQHNPNPLGVVCAIDITTDPAVGLDCHVLMEQLDASNDPRIFYLIHDHQIDNSDDTRTPYTGVNSHTRHLHVSVRYQSADLYDNPRPWAIPMLTTPEDDMPLTTDEIEHIAARCRDYIATAQNPWGLDALLQRLVRIDTLLVQLGAHPVDVDEKALAGYLAPMVAGQVAHLSPADLHDLTAALVTEAGRRLVAADAAPVAAPQGLLAVAAPPLAGSPLLGLLPEHVDAAAAPSSGQHYDDVEPADHYTEPATA